MKKLKIFLADLSHNYMLTSQQYMPYTVGLVASYTKKIFGDLIEVRLFKYPDKLYKALNQEGCDVLGCTTYVWNYNLAHWACRVAKAKNPNVITVLGGPSFVKKTNLKKEYFLKNDYIDVRVPYEGEIAFSNLLKLILKHGIKNKNKIFSGIIDGCVYLNKKSNQLVEGGQPRIQSLDIVPSPYITGLMDEFFDGNLGPTIQTTRGCPFKCNFCHESDDHFHKIKKHEIQFVHEELEYIGKKAHETKTVAYLSVADSNFGMFLKDKFVSEKILELNKKYNWPLGIIMSTGKHFERVFETTYMLKDLFDFTMSVQSMSQDVLDVSGRTNIPVTKFKKFAEMLRKKGRPTTSETLLPLPKESLKSFFKGMKELIEMKVSRIVSNTLMFLDGTVYEDKEYTDKYGYVSKYRLLPRQFGIYGGEKIFETEKVGITTNTLSFKDYLETRKFAFIIEMLFNSKIFREIEYFLEDYKFSYYEYIYFVYKNLKNAHPDIQNIMQSFERQSVQELKDSEESLSKYYSREDNFKKILNGEEGGNLKYIHKGLLLSKYQNVWLDFALNHLKKFLISNEIKIGKDFNNIISFIRCKFDGILDASKTRVAISNSFDFDIIKWINQENRTRRPLREFKNGRRIRIKFTYDKNQITERDYHFKKYKPNNRLNLSNIMLAIRPQQKLFRKYQYAE